MKEAVESNRRTFLGQIPAIAAATALPAVAVAETVEKPLPPNPDDMSQAERWLRSVPKIGKDDIKLTVELTMSRMDWFMLAEGAAHNDWTLEKAIEFMVMYHNDGVVQWSNEDYRDADEQEQYVKDRIASRRVA